MQVDNNNPVDGSGKHTKTSPAVCSKSDNVYVTNCTITLAATGIALDGCENAFLKKVVSCCIDGMFNLKDCKNSIIEGCHQNGNTLPRNGYSDFDIPELENRVKEENIFDEFFSAVYPEALISIFVRWERYNAVYYEKLLFKACSG